MYLNERDINIETDRVISKEDIIVQFGTSNLSVHEVKVCENKDGYNYYLFEYKNGLAIMNYTHDEYEKLKEKLPLKGISIFDNTYNSLSKVPESYR